MNILIAGEGGQGIQTIAKFLADLAYNKGYSVSLIPHYGVEMRMGISFAYIRIDKKPINYPKFVYADILAILTKREAEILEKFVERSTRIINVTEIKKFMSDHNILAKNLNFLALGVILKELNITDFRIEIDKVKNEIKSKFSNKLGLEDMIKALEIGFTLDPDFYSLSLNKIKKDTFQTIVDKDNKKEHIKYPNLCKGCGLCIEKCPVKALSWSKEKTNYVSRMMPKIDMDKCIICKKCENICPDSAIKIKVK